ncbi:hypothetical protein K466DRAFT_651420 [Polyporus arcularius HHB13444]|uniref:Uncharacterized protein n=1 Tax=Polyporus arcularius HHB13444 TaxID=1314778 RepID=A0A5C3PSE8_9APHY|nr:hypothetical protein K466DRAFT_651420 [Polyporus arcularius HHB13444]
MTANPSIIGQDIAVLQAYVPRGTRRNILDVNDPSQLDCRPPINSLPPEILIKIFRAVQTEPWIDDSHGFRSFVQLHWPQIQAVCRHWRKVLCSNPQSWRKIEVYSRHEWLQVSLERCADIHADVILHGRSLRDSDTLSILSRWTSTVRSLTIRHLESHRRVFVASWLTARHWPVLEALDITGEIDRSIRSPPCMDVRLTMENVPALRILRLQADPAHPPANPSIYPQLRTLDLRLCEWLVPFSRIFDILECMKNLEVLHLEKTFLQMVGVPETRRPEGPAASHARIVTLPRLRSLTLASNTYRTTTQILDGLRLPAVISVRLDIDIDESDPQTIAAALPRDHSLAFPLLGTITSVEVTSEHVQSYGLHGYSITRSHEFDVMLSTDTGDMHDWPFSLSHALADLVDVFAHSPITELIATGVSSVSESTWVEVLDRFHGLEAIDIGDCRPETAHALWTALSRTPSSLDGGSVYCPRLQVVHTIAPYTAAGTEEDFWVMPRVLRARKESGHTVQKLVLLRDRGVEDDRLSAYLVQVKERSLGDQYAFYGSSRDGSLYVSMFSGATDSLARMSLPDTSSDGQ